MDIEKQNKIMEELKKEAEERLKREHKAEKPLPPEEFTKLFKTQYSIMKAMTSAPYPEDEDSESMETSIDAEFKKSTASPPWDKDFEVGDIVMTSIMDTPQPVIVALIRKWDDDTYLVTPFSEYSYPATDAELWLQDHYDTPVMKCKVLQVWATMVIKAKNIEGWKVGKLSEKYQDMAFKVFCALMQNEPAPFPNCAGTPLTDLKEVRMEYIKEQWVRIRGLIALDEHCKKMPEKVKQKMGISPK